MTEEYVSFFKELGKSAMIQFSAMSGTEQLVGWFPVIPLNEENSIWLGISDSGIWVIKKELKLMALDNEDRYKYLIVLLEYSFDDIKDKIDELDLNEFLKEKIIFYFPFKNIIQVAFKYGSNYWIELALNWYVNMDIKDRIVFFDSLNEVVLNKSISQRTRHYVLSEIKKMSLLKKNKNDMDMY